MQSAAQINLLAKIPFNLNTPVFVLVKEMLLILQIIINLI